MKMRKIQDSLRKLLCVWWFEFRNIVCSSRWLVLSIISFLMLQFYLEEIIKFAKDYDLTVYPAALPFLFADGTFSSLGMLVLIFLVSVFPVTNHLQQNVLLRSGCKIWGNAQMLTIVSLVLLWIAEMQIFICLMIGGNLSFSGWGKAWGTCAAGLLKEYGYVNAIGVSQKVIMAYEPGQALGRSILLIWLTGIIFGEFIFCVDGVCKNFIGEIILSIWSLAWLVISNFSALADSPVLRRISPANWLDIEHFIGNSRNYLWILLTMCGIILFFYLLNHLLIHKKVIRLN